MSPMRMTTDAVVLRLPQVHHLDPMMALTLDVKGKRDSKCFSWTVVGQSEKKLFNFKISCLPFDDPAPEPASPVNHHDFRLPEQSSPCDDQSLQYTRDHFTHHPDVSGGNGGLANHSASHLPRIPLPYSPGSKRNAGPDGSDGDPNIKAGDHNWPICAFIF